MNITFGLGESGGDNVVVPAVLEKISVESVEVNTADNGVSVSSNNNVIVVNNSNNIVEIH